MLRVLCLFLAALTFGLAITAMAEPPTKGQRMELNRLLDNGAIPQVDLEVFLEKYRTPEPEGCTQVEVNYDLTRNDIAKGYDGTSKDFLGGDFHAAPRGKGKVKKEVCWFQFDFDAGVYPREAKKRILASGEFLVADLWELNALGAAKPDLQRKFRIDSLIPIVWRCPDCDHYGPQLDESRGERWLTLSPVFDDMDLQNSIRFLAVRK
jgi:hypothetical protein